MTITAPYGSWDSPLSARLLTEAGVGLGGASMVGDRLYWVEARPTEAGRIALVRREPDGTTLDVTPIGFNARTRIHEYGGGAVGIDGDVVISASFPDQRVYRLDGADPVPITPEPDIAAGARYGDFAFHGDLVICVRELHRVDGEPINEIVVFPVDGSRPPRPIVSGHDFFSNPRVSPDGSRVAWLAWDHPRMPWDGTELFFGDIGADGTVSNVEPVAGHATESIFQPEWSPDGFLHFVSDRTGWWNLYRREPDGTDTALCEKDVEFGHPQWVFGMRRYAFLPDGRIAAVYQEDGWFRLGVIDHEGMRTVDLDRSDLAPSISVGGGKVWLVGGGPALPDAVFGVDVNSGAVEIVKQALSVDFDPALYSTPENITFPTTDDAVAHAFYYPPNNPGFEAPEGDLPPLVVMSHGGPTSATTAGFRLEKQYWTSRGFGVVDVNYRGSTGYGRAYRNALGGRWGIVDTDDCIAAANFLVARGDTDPTRLAIRGGSAGGYTTLCALTFHDVFAVGASYFGVADCSALAEHTHKFESRYLDGLIGPYPAAEALYRERSPVHHTDQLSTPMLILQGLDDEVVPPDQAEQMVAALKDKGIPHAYVAFEGEGHGFRIASNQITALESELSFYAWAFGFVPAGDIPPVEIVQ
ncbi:MAG: S9 family peptidase [Acidimicrobiia bacterium]|nr:S9 family peptidase [Acidimicrobiia bacterium]MDH5503214.1 S9 family peptidase [Acidimicrobiia bacterium]